MPSAAKNLAFRTVHAVAFCAIGTACLLPAAVTAADGVSPSVPAPDTSTEYAEPAETVETVEVFDLSAALNRKQRLNAAETKADAVASSTADSEPISELPGLPLNADALESRVAPLQPAAKPGPASDIEANSTIPAGDIVRVRGNLYSPGVELIPLDVPNETLEPVEEAAASGNLPWELPGFDDLPPLDILDEPEIAQSDDTDRLYVPPPSKEKVPFVIPEVKECEVPLGKPLASLTGDTLFQPLSQIELSGMSTAPPLADEPNTVLELPQDDSCEFLETGYPAVYATEPQFAMCSPYRSPYPFRHQPLYYEDPNLERCGQSWWYLTNVKSVCLFASQIAAWPLHAVVQPIQSQVPALPSPPAYYRFKLDVYSPYLRRRSDYQTEIKATRKIRK